jgi:hypothetical protein
MAVSRLTYDGRGGTTRAVVALIVALACSGALATRASATGLTVSIQPPQVVEGQALNGTIATFVDANAFGGSEIASRYTAKITWGDGVTSPGTVTTGGGVATVSPTGVGHTYAEEGSYQLTVEVSDSTDSSSGSDSAPLTVADAPLFAALPGSPTTFTGAGSSGTGNAMAAFEAGIGGTNHNATLGEQAGGFRTVNWDEVKLDGSDPGTKTIFPNHVVTIPDDRYATRGIDLRAPIAVAGDGFLSVNPFVSGLFPAFSARNVVAPFSGNTLKLDVVAPTAPGTTPQPALTSGFGAVFLNVKIPNSTSIEYLSGDTVVGRVFAPVGGIGQPSFVGELFASPVVTSVAIALGTAQILSFDGTSFAPGVESSETPTNNLVAMDDLALAEPTPEAPAVIGSVGVPLSATAGFSDSDPNSNAGHFTASIDWGDGTRGAAQVTTAASGGFTVSGAHTYATPGTFTVTIAVQDLGGAKRTFHTTATVAAASSPPAPLSTSPPPPTSPHCSLIRPSAAFRGIVGTNLGAGHKHRVQDLTVWRLGAVADCDKPASVVLTAVASLTPAHRAHTPRGGARSKATISLGKISANLSANTSAKLAIVLRSATSAKLRSATARHERVSVKLTLSAAGGGSATATISSLKLR